MSSILSEEFDAIIVGSDQVWRPKYSPCLSNYYLDFCKRNPITKIAYAASFGVDYWEASFLFSLYTRSLIQEFDLITVRESSAVELCRKHLKVTPHHVLDPTLLVEPRLYLELVDESRELQELTPPLNTLCIYAFSFGVQEWSHLSNIASEASFQLHVANPTTSYKLGGADPVAYWLWSFKNSSAVITDSFHGLLFSIIFRKPFLVVNNKQRGSARFISILNDLGLRKRLYNDLSEIDVNLLSEPLPDSLSEVLAQRISQSQNTLFSKLNDSDNV